MQRIKAMELLDLLGYDVAGRSTNDLYQQLYELGYDWDGEEWVQLEETRGGRLMPSPDKIHAIKELRARCDIGLAHAKDAIDQWMAVHPGKSYEDAWRDIASAMPPRPKTEAESLVLVRAELARGVI